MKMTKFVIWFLIFKHTDNTLHQFLSYTEFHQPEVPSNTVVIDTAESDTDISLTICGNVYTRCTMSASKGL